MKNKKSHPPSTKLKVLPLEKWMRYEGDRLRVFESPGITPVEPKLKRPGIYLLGNECWFEIPDGRAFAFNKVDFDNRLARYDAERISNRQMAALKEIMAAGLATKEQASLCHLCEHIRQLRMSSFRAKIQVREILKNFRK